VEGGGKGGGGGSGLNRSGEMRYSGRTKEDSILPKKEVVYTKSVLVAERKHSKYWGDQMGGGRVKEKEEGKFKVAEGGSKGR